MLACGGAFTAASEVKVEEVKKRAELTIVRSWIERICCVVPLAFAHRVCRPEAKMVDQCSSFRPTLRRLPRALACHISRSVIRVGSQGVQLGQTALDLAQPTSTSRPSAEGRAKTEGSESSLVTTSAKEDSMAS